MINKKSDSKQIITKNFQKVLNLFLGKMVGVYGINIHFHGKLEESDDSSYERKEGMVKEPHEWAVQLNDKNTHGYISFKTKNIRKIILNQPGQQRIQIFIKF